MHLCQMNMKIDAQKERKTSRGTLTALDLQRAVLLIKWVSAQVHHAGGSGRNPAHTERVTVSHYKQLYL